jgi:sugar transferase (PEP-CTERM/EpsH1 system associated)
MHVVCSLDPGGMEMGVVKLVNGIDSRRVRSAICSTRPGRLKSLVAPAVPVFELARRQGNDVRLVWQLAQLFRRERPHIVHTHAWGTLLEGLVAARCARVPAVVHGEHGTLQLRRHQRWMQRAGWSCVDQVLSVSTRLSERIATEIGFPLETIRTIRNGVDLARFGHHSRIAARAALQLPIDRPVVGTIGRLVPVKDHVSLVDAMRVLQREQVDAVLVIAGDGPLEETIRRQAASLGFDGRVVLLGHRPDVEVVLAALDLFVLPSVSEGLPNTVLEAMASRLPVVATRVGGVEEVVQDGVTGVLVPPRSPYALGRAISDLLRDRDRAAAMGAMGRRRAETEFALDETVRRYEELYLRLAARRRAA